MVWSWIFNYEKGSNTVDWKPTVNTSWIAIPWRRRRPAINTKTILENFKNLIVWILITCYLPIYFPAWTLFSGISTSISSMDAPFWHFKSTSNFTEQFRHLKNTETTTARRIMKRTPASPPLAAEEYPPVAQNYKKEWLIRRKRNPVMSQVRSERDSIDNITKFEEETLEGIR